MHETVLNMAHGEAEDDGLKYNPNHLLDTLIHHLQLKSDAALSRALKVTPPVISRIRHHRLPVGACMLIRMHEVSGLPISDLRYLMGDRGQGSRTDNVLSKRKE